MSARFCLSLAADFPLFSLQSRDLGPQEAEMGAVIWSAQVASCYSSTAIFLLMLQEYTS